MGIKPVALAAILAAATAGLPPLPGGYNLIGVIGQSNPLSYTPILVGTDDVADTLGAGGTQLVKQWDTGKGNASFHTIKGGQDPLPAAGTGGINSGKTTPASQFARQYAAATGKPVLLVFLPVGLTDLTAGNSLWKYTATPANPPLYTGNGISVSSASNLYSNLIYEANLAITAAIAALPGSAYVGTIFGQGETDADYPVASTVYQAALQAVIDGIRSQITGASNSWFAIMSMLPEAVYDEALIYGGAINAASAGNPHYRAIHTAHKLTAMSRARCAFIRGSWGYADRAADLTDGFNRALHYRLRGGAVDIATRAMAALPTLRGKSTTAPIAAPAAPTWRNAPSASSGQSIVMDIYRDFSQGNDDLIVDYRVTGAGSWTSYYAGNKGLFKHSERLHLGGLTASTSYDIRIADKNAAGTSAYLTATGVSTTSDTDTGYTFETDTLGAQPAGISNWLGRLVTANSGLSGFGKSMVPSGNVAGTGFMATLEKYPHVADSVVTWRVGNTHSANLNGAAGGMILRAQPDLFCGRTGSNSHPGLNCGYYFCVEMRSSALKIYRVDPDSDITQLGTGFAGGQSDYWFRATISGTVAGGVVLKFERSANGVSGWSTVVNVTDTVGLGYDIGQINYLVDSTSSFPTEFYVESITRS